MKKLFNRTLFVLCAVMLLISVVFAWAAAEEAATPTDLIPQEGEFIPEEPEKEPEAEGDGITSVEVVITKTLTVGQSWEGKMKKTKPAVLKLDVAKPGLVYMLVEGKDVWATVEKSDRQTENPTRTQTDPETDRMVISWEAEEGSYLIIMGPVEPNLLAAAKVTFMDKQAYEAWEAENAADNKEKGVTEEGTQEKIPEENQKDITGDNPEEDVMPIKTSESPIEDEEKKAEAVLALDEQQLLENGYVKVQVLRQKGTEVYDRPDEEFEPIMHLDASACLWVMPISDIESFAEIHYIDNIEAKGFILWDDVLIILQNEKEDDEETELPARSVKIISTLDKMSSIAFGQEITMTAELTNFRDNDIYSCQWMFSTNGVDYQKIENATDLIYSYYNDHYNIFYHWQIVIVIEDNE